MTTTQDGKPSTETIKRNIERLPSGLLSERVRIPGVGRRRISGRTMKELDAERRALFTQIDNGSYDAGKRGQITLGDWFHQWLGNHRGKPATHRHYADMYVRFIKPHLAGRRLVDLTPGAIEDWLSTLEKAGETANNRDKALTTLSASLGMKARGAEFDQRLPQGNPCRFSRVDVPKPSAWRKISAAEFDRLLDATPDYYKPLLLLLWHLALRFGEATALRRSDVDVLHRRLHIEVNTKQLEKNDEFNFKRERWIGTPKGGKERLLGYVPERAFRVIEELMDQGGGMDDPLVPAKLVHGRSKLTWDQAAEIRALGEYVPGKGAREGRVGGLTLTEVAGRYGLHKATVVNLLTGKTWTQVNPKLDKHLSYSSWRKNVWAPAVKKAGLGSLRPHDLRHSAASTLADGGIRMRVLQDILGHASLAQTEAYVHVDTDTQAEEWKRAVGE